MPIHEIDLDDEPQETPNTDHVVLKGNAFTCLHCGVSYAMNLPCPINLMVDSMRSFTNSHAHCEKATVE